MASISSIGVVPRLSRPCIARVVLAQSLALSDELFQGIRPALDVDYIPFDLADLVVCVVVLWSAVAASVALWWLVRGLTIWLQKPPKPKATKPVPPVTTEDLMERVRETFKNRVRHIEQSDLPPDAKKQAKQEAERQYMRDVSEVLQCK